MTTPTLMLTPEEAAAQLRIGRTGVFALLKSGDLRSKKIGVRRLIPYDALVEYIASLPDEPPAPA